MGLSYSVWGNPALGSVGCMVGLTVNSKRVYTKGDLPGLLLPGPLSLWWTPANHTSTRDPPTRAGSFDSVSRGGSAPFLWVLVCIRFCLCPPRLESLFPPVLWKSYNQIPLTCKGIPRFPRDSQSLCRIPSLGSLMWGSEPLQQWENFLGIIVLQVVGHPPSRFGIWFYHHCAPPTISL